MTALATLESDMQFEEEFNFTEPFPQSDVAFIIEGRPVYAVKSILCMWSTVMDCMIFSHDLPRSGDRLVITLPNKRFGDFIKLMQVLNPPYHPIDDNNVTAVLPLVDEYQIKPIVVSCEKYLLQQPPSVHNLVLAEKYRCSQLQAFCLRVLKQQSLNNILQDREFKNLSLNAQQELLRHGAEKLVREEKLAEQMEAVIDLVDNISEEGLVSNDKTCLCSSDSLPHHEIGTSSKCHECQTTFLANLKDIVANAKQFVKSGGD